MKHSDHARNAMRFGRVHWILAAFGAVLIAPMAQSWAEASEHWEADSTAAFAITGDVTFTPTKVTMAKNITFAIKFVRVAPGVTWMPRANADTPSSLYRMVQSKNPVLLNGNQLCGPKAVTYISIAKAGHNVFLSAYTGEKLPTFGWDNLCAGFTYSKTSSKGRSN